MMTIDTLTPRWRRAIGALMRTRLALATALAAGLWLAVEPSIASSARRAAELANGQPAVSAVDAVGMTVDDMDRSVAFLSDVLTFEKISDVEVTGSEYERLQGVFGLRMRIVRMKLGEEILELTEYLAPKGRPVPVDARSNDRAFQHVAIIVSDMDQAYARLREFVEEARFDHLGVFTYSKEEGTHSGTLDEVPAKIAEQRRRDLMRRQRTISKRRMKTLVGSELEVLVEGASDESEYLLEGRHAGQAPEIDGKVFLSLADGDAPPRAGDLVRARVDSFADYDLGATVVATIARAKRTKLRLPVLGSAR